ncbi:hypothetical protein FBU30_009990 [Linnemannia zychae]|nr:hypothetical protein FBU30_009990 [Linnemannia zychae]
MRLFTSSKRSNNRALSSWTLICALVLLCTFLASDNSAKVSAAASGFCAECQTYAMVVQQCGGTFEPKDIEINGVYNPPQSVASCVCKSVIQRLLWNCARCELLAGFQSKSPPPTQYQTTCISWGQTIDTWNAGYSGPVAPGTTSPLGGGNNPVSQPPPNPGPNPGPSTTGGTGGNNNNGNSTNTSSGALPSSSSDESNAGSGESSGPNGTAIGISLGLIGFAAVGGGAAVFMMKRRRRHAPLELDGTYVGLDDQWEKPPRPQSPPMQPAPIANGGAMNRGLMRPSPFESRPGGSVSGGSVVGGYDGSYDQYDYHGGSTVVGSTYGDYDDGYGKQHGGYNQGYNHGYPPHDHQNGYNRDYGYDHPVPTSGPHYGGR